MRRIRRILLAVFASIGLLYTIVTLTPVTNWWAQALMGPWTDARGEVLIVLAAEDSNAGIIGLGTYWRCVYAVLVWREGGVKTVVVSGPGGTATEMRDLLAFEGVPGDRILVEGRSKSTRENALFVKEMVGDLPGSKVLLTGDLYMYRAVRTFRKAGLEVTPRPFPYALKLSSGWQRRWPVFLDLCIETVKIAGYRLRGWI